jgi:hypothetical protein
MTVLMVAACNGNYALGKLDVKGAFIQTEMKGTPVYIKCRGRLRDLILEAYPVYKKYVGQDGILDCRLKKALYGCVQASKLWYEKLRSFLLKQGYVCSEVDPCLFRKVLGDRVYLLVVYVDDVLVVAELTELKRLREAFTQEFRWVTMVIGQKQSYLGMLIAVERGVVTVDMRYYLGKILSDHDNLPVATNPGAKNSFMVDEASPILDDKGKKVFHTNVAKLLYLSKRARPDVIAVVGFLCTRVKGPTEEDMKKLKKVLGYLKGTQEWIMKIKPEGMFRVEAYIDASFSAHPDGKSQSGIVVRVGGASVYFGSKKQKCVSKSPTEAELVALSDHVGFVELFGELVNFILNESRSVPPVVYQDSTSVIEMITSGGGVTRTKHMRTRLYLVLEAIRENRIIVRRVGTKEMKADGFTKCLDGSSFVQFRKEVLHLTD